MRKIKYFTGIKKFDQAIISLDNHLVISGKSYSTRKNYNSKFCQFLLDAQKLPEECTKQEIINVIVGIKGKKRIRSASLKMYVCAVRYYLLHIAERMDLFTRIPVPKTRMYDIEILNINELQRLFAACNNCRNLLIVKLLFETGIRISELLNIKAEDFDLYQQTLIIRNSKNGITRVVHFGQGLLDLLIQYKKINKTLFSDSLFNREFHPFFNLSRNSIRFLLNSAIKRSGIQKRVTPHLLRHAFAVHYLNFGGTLPRLQKLLGHAYMRTTLNYLKHAVLPECKNISVLDKLNETVISKTQRLVRA